jgi:VanZ family protein
LSSSAIEQPIPRSLWRKVQPWLPTFLWLCLIAVCSSDRLSSAHTKGILWRVLHAAFPSLSYPSFEVLHHFIRKSAHFAFYGVLSWFAFRSWRATLQGRARWTFQWSGLALALTLATAILDEFHQTFVPSRTGSPYDVLLDMMGALFFQILIASFSGFATNRKVRV